MNADRHTRPFDIVLCGATGFTGGLVAERLASASRAQPLRWALAGRDPGRLDEVRRRLSAQEPSCHDLPILVGDARDAAAMADIAAQTRVICTTVGPFARHGSALVAACARKGTDYCDITGEVQWIRRMIDAHHHEARASGARIVPTCGFDSIPSDLGVLLLQDEMLRRHGRRAHRVTAFFGETRGSFSGGTFASLMAALDEADDEAVRQVIADPYGLDPVPRQGGPDGPDPRGVGYDRAMKVFTAPFVMAVVNTRVVRRSHALLGYPWGHDFRYREVMSFPANAKGLATAVGLTATIGGFLLATARPGGLRRLIARRLPAPGTGPSAEARTQGHFVVRVVGEGDPAEPGESPPRLVVTVSDDADPGYGSTSKMLSQSALCLAFDPVPAAGGVLTPATALGTRLIERLRAMGLRFDAA